MRSTTDCVCGGEVRGVVISAAATTSIAVVPSLAASWSYKAGDPGGPGKKTANFRKSRREDDIDDR
jgi:hypothetical protein